MSEEQKQSWLAKLLGGDHVLSKGRKQLYWLFLVLFIGIAVMILSSFFNIRDQVMPELENNAQPPSTETAGLINKENHPKTMEDYEKLYENKIIEILTNMIGVDEVTVKVNLDSSEEIVVEKNQNYTEQNTKEQDKQGGTREIKDVKRDDQVVLYQSDNDEQPLVLKTLKPKVRGVVIVAKGADKIQVKTMIAEAVQRLLDVPPYKIAILPRKG
ncbi:stage III sporulation protein AG [Tepidibacillus fermentans]|uniref:Stage III sporulation protein AG n=1 Tax=Tepidibacillus fermentans TaxID=1281767 RepID=A0A4V2UT37_9BACI|nr:stage III sporulation protein AG [Tepidibacillus fermentans]TCS84029.1 stage III sporulation protein AG [Tepidibacillus fermentans]